MALGFPLPAEGGGVFADQVADEFRGAAGAAPVNGDVAAR